MDGWPLSIALDGGNHPLRDAGGVRYFVEVETVPLAVPFQSVIHAATLLKISLDCKCIVTLPLVQASKQGVATMCQRIEVLNIPNGLSEPDIEAIAPGDQLLQDGYWLTVEIAFPAVRAPVGRLIKHVQCRAPWGGSGFPVTPHWTKDRLRKAVAA